MNRRIMPPAAAAPDMPARAEEVRLPQREAAFDMRNAREAIP